MPFPELARQKSAPDVLERLRRHRRVPDRIGDRGVSEIVLEPPRIHSATRQRVSCRMAQHVHVYRERQLGSLASPIHHVGRGISTHDIHRSPERSAPDRYQAEP